MPRAKITFPTSECDRGRQVARVIKLAIKLSQVGVCVSQLEGYTPANGSSRSTKIFYRDMHTLEQAGIPVYKDDHGRYRVDAHFMRRFL